MVRNQKIAIIGAGLAGCSLAYELSGSSNFDIAIFDKNSDIATEASGNFAGILEPYLTSDNNFSDQFHTLGYSILLEFINQYRNDIEICNQGVLQILSDEKELNRYQKIFTKREIADDLARLISPQELSELLGKNTPNKAVYYLNAVSVVPKSICQLWLKLSNAKLKLDNELLDIKKLEDNTWRLKFNNFTEDFDIVVFAGGYPLFKNISLLQNIPVYPSQGQLTVIKRCFDTSNNIMDKGYIIPSYKDNLQVIGATFRDNNDTSGDIRQEDNTFNINQIKQIFNDKNYNVEIVNSRVATRCVTSDHLPLVGRLADYDSFEQVFYKPLSKGYPKSKMPKIEYQQSLYVSSGFGSKGLCSSLLAAQIITAYITNQNQKYSDKLLEALAIERFWTRSFKKGIKFS
ncbi:FAD-dependent 5-carboxymethylaminomethyl-2-thiouridine(34) oxidoreductase MnmC [Francisella noatunensis]|uniref:FAD-dependent 5-carboxymethylaminomethyl-2-thiouridine(34) oxidoreductase MnmC n=1 Tax=Francisella noatunensis TaxID=657445 RepID=A0A9Q2QFI4_9GAMM|nr:FAD-dependent 5-carboxymethylaminomethyl-2-thiouridine(34) oxidoreductase MnmC [Francisella noatunensis]MBK2028757.1 FAD-dependent 5-carboxymethylaminomethyl-2-thiouridine(34) oxidoreductase MnmC [Francisella noatunensis]MBK2034471.1 FAD-dependent 5-carboxymethylaminomethyl-2-thiouridine(34) oxidoreductase MnmC [Francisella noatunensis]MBK2049084.1 FAD-dependent 5-carboxymethylaminomethyl-2-thiouridine(34) oxidoreductase MnmC [Francisella noatunensis]MBK2050349.1 FAD-dependent 5-carboxymethy